MSYLVFTFRHPHLIYTSITGYGQTGPLSSKGGYDVIAAAVGGLLHITGEKVSHFLFILFFSLRDKNLCIELNQTRK